MGTRCFIMKINGKQICFTGTLKMKRADATKLAKEAGAKVMSNVSGNTDILVAGPGAGSKIAVAESKGVEVWTEAQFMAAVSGGSAPAAKKAPKRAKKIPEK